MTTPFEFLSQTEILYRLGVMLFHSLWQVTVLGLIYFLVRRGLSNRYMRLRYCLGYGVLLSMAICPLLSVIMMPPSVAPTVAPTVEHTVTKKPVHSETTESLESVTPLSEEPEFGGEPAFSGLFDVHSLDDEQFTAVIGEAMRNTEDPELLEELREILQARAAASAPVNPVAPEEKSPEHVATSGLVLQKHWLETLQQEVLQPLSPVAGLLWLCGVTFFSLRLVGDWFSLQRLRKDALPVLDGPWFERLEEISRRFGIKTNVLLGCSEKIDSPILLGLLKPIVLLPMSLLSGYAPEEIEVILAHELAHVRRYDYLGNLVQLIVETLLFYHPIAWWVSRGIRHDREFICDDYLVYSHGTDRLLYAKVLLHLEQTRNELYGENTMKKVLSSPAATSKPLLTRVHRILGVPAPRYALVDWCAGLLILTLLAAFPVFSVLSDFSSAQLEPEPVQATVLNEPLPVLEAIPFAVPTAPETTTLLEAIPANPVRKPVPSAPQVEEVRVEIIENRDGQPHATQQTMKADSRGVFVVDTTSKGQPVIHPNVPGDAALYQPNNVTVYQPYATQNKPKKVIEVISLKKIIEMVAPKNSELAQMNPPHDAYSAYSTASAIQQSRSNSLATCQQLTMAFNSLMPELQISTLNVESGLILVSGSAEDIATLKETITSLEQSLEKIQEAEKKTATPTSVSFSLPATAATWDPFSTTTRKGFTATANPEARVAVPAVSVVDQKVEEVAPGKYESKTTIRASQEVPYVIEKAEPKPEPTFSSQMGVPEPVPGVEAQMGVPVGNLPLNRVFPVMNTAIAPAAPVVAITNPQWTKIEETEKKLRTTTMELQGININLQDFVGAMIDKGIYAEIDGNSLSKAAVDLDQSFDLNWDGISIELALKRLCRKLGDGYIEYTITVDGDILILSKEAADKTLLTKVYDLHNRGSFAKETAVSFLNDAKLPGDYVQTGEHVYLKAPYHVHKSFQALLESFSVEK